MKGFKGFNKDMTCRGFQYEVGKSYTFDGRIELCQKGFHFCESLSDCFDYYEKDDSRFCEIEASGDIRKGGDKNCCSEIKIVRELSPIEINRAVYGYGYGDGDGNGDGNGNGDGYGYGYGYGDGDGDGNGNGYGYGYGNGYGKNIQKILTFTEVA